MVVYCFFFFYVGAQLGGGLVCFFGDVSCFLVGFGEDGFG